MSAIFFQAVGHPIQAIITSLCRDIIVFVPCLILFGYLGEQQGKGNGINLCLFAPIVADVAGCFVAGILTLVLFRKIDRKEIK